MKNWKHLNRLPVYIGIAAILTGCGTSTTDFTTPLGSTGISGSTGSVLPLPIPSPSSTTSNLANALSFSNFAMSGPGGANPTYSTYTNSGAYLSTDNVLEVEVQAQPGTALLEAPSGQYSGFSTNYHCISYQVSIYDNTGTLLSSQNTNLLSIPSDTTQSICAGSPSTQVLNFSGAVQNPHGGIDVRVQALSYDWYCQLWYTTLSTYENTYGAFAQYYDPYYSYYSYWCPSKAVYQTHQVNASIEVQVNGTQFF